MAALSATRDTKKRQGGSVEIGVASGVTIWQGGMVAINASGDAVPAGSAAAKGKAVGRAAQTVTGGATAGAVTVVADKGIFAYQSNSANPVTRASRGATAYALDDQTVSSLDTLATIAGTVFDADDTGVWIDMRG